MSNKLQPLDNIEKDFARPTYRELGDGYHVVAFNPQRAYIMKNGQIIGTCHLTDVERVAKEHHAQDLESSIDLLLAAGYTTSEAREIVLKIQGKTK